MMCMSLPAQGPFAPLSTKELGSRVITSMVEQLWVTLVVLQVQGKQTFPLSLKAPGAAPPMLCVMADICCGPSSQRRSAASALGVVDFGVVVSLLALVLDVGEVTASCSVTLTVVLMG